VSLRAGLERLLDLVDDPILVKELRGAFRRRRYLYLHTGLLLVLGLALLGAIFVGHDVTQVEPSEVGKATFLVILGLQTALVFLLFPAVTCTAVIEEREGASYDLLITTRLAPSRIVLGKLLAAVVYGFTFLVATLPLVAVTFLYGGISPGQIALAYAALAVTGGVCATYGLLVSSLSVGVGRAVVRTFLGLPAMSLLVLYPVAMLVAARVVLPLSGDFSGVALLDGLSWTESILLHGGVALWPLLWGSLFFLLAQNRLQPERANKDTPLRVWFLIAWALGLGSFVAFTLTHPASSQSGRTLSLAQLVIGAVVIFTLASVAFIVEDDRPVRGRDTRGVGPLALLLPGAARGAAFVLALAAVTLLAGQLLHPDLATAQQGGGSLRPLAQARAWGLAWAFAFLLAVGQAALLLGRVAASAFVARVWLVVLLIVLTLYPLIWYYLEPTRSSAQLHHGYALSPITAAISLFMPERSAYDRQLILFGPPADRIQAELERWEVERREEEARLNPSQDRAVADTLARERNAQRAAVVERVTGGGLRVRTASTAFYALAGLALLAVNLALARREGRRAAVAAAAARAERERERLEAEVAPPPA
jgi:ABC-type transport system involved in multi-copper enzyme maturation permease subunit